jgi:hypothetical protein
MDSMIQSTEEEEHKEKLRAASDTELLQNLHISNQIISQRSMGGKKNKTEEIPEDSGEETEDSYDPFEELP